MWDDLLARLFGTQTGWAFIARKAPDGKWHERAYKYPGQAKLILNEIDSWNRSGNSVYFCPHLLIDTVRQKQFAAPLTALYADLDEINPNTLKPDVRPTIAWETSNGRYAALWLLSDYAQPKEGEIVNKQLSYHLGADKGGWDLTQYLRWPGTTNYKYDPPHEGKLLWDDGPVHSVGAMRSVLPDVPGAETTVVSIVEIPDALVRLATRVPVSAMKILRSSPSPQEDWSDALWKLECLLVEAGFNRDEVFSLVKQSAWNKYARDGRGDTPLITEINKAFSTVKTRVPSDPSPLLDFISVDELLESAETASWLVQDIWMSSNVGWIAGVGKNYKSVLALDLAVSVAAGVPFLGKYPVLRPGPVLMVLEEDPRYRVRNRLRAMFKSKNVASEAGLMGWVEEGKRYRIVWLPPTGVPLHLTISKGFSFVNPEMLKELEEAIDAVRPRLVVLDPFYTMTVGLDEYKAGEITKVFNEIKRLRNLYGCAFTIVHHFRKGGAGVERLYGSMAFYAFSENTFWVTRSGRSVTIERDIKDAIFNDVITVEIESLVDEYKVTVREGPVVFAELTRILLQSEKDDSISMNDLIRATGAKRYEMTRALSTMEERGWITCDSGGRGGGVRVSIQPLMRAEAAEEM